MSKERRYFSGGAGIGENSILAVSHNSNTPGLNLDRAIYMGISGFGRASTIAISIDDAEELRGALKDLLDEAAPKKRFVVDTTRGAFSTLARSNYEAIKRAREWAERNDARVGTRVWEVKQ